MTPIDHPLRSPPRCGGVLRFHRQGDNLPVQVDELLRLLEMFRVLPRQIREQGGEGLLAQVHHREGAGHDVIEVSVLILQAPVQLQTNQIGLTVADQPHRDGHLLRRGAFLGLLIVNSKGVGNIE